MQSMQLPSIQDLSAADVVLASDAEHMKKLSSSKTAQRLANRYSAALSTEAAAKLGGHTAEVRPARISTTAIDASHKCW